MSVTHRKRRTRAHIIADLSFHHVAYQIAKCGFSIEAIRSDYGYDLSIFTYDARGEIENGNIFVQLKATDHIEKYKKKAEFSFRISKKDLDLWQREPFPVYLILFDTVSETAYWLYLQEYLQRNGITTAKMKRNSLGVPFNAAQIVDKKSVRTWRANKAKVLAKIGSIRHAKKAR
jgi:hypothetical protein